ncbi:unnamed protein product [Durusdinium trenchii]|uniref:Uncharacterized protein n=1 Tax=Durusdinium trenchii TaxID=1381693 RepID=A0ABP0RFM6_9DINO
MSSHPETVSDNSVWKLLLCVAGIWSCFFAYGILQESIFVYKTPAGDKFKQTTVLLIVEHAVSALVALAIIQLSGGSSSKWSQHLKSQGIVACPLVLDIALPGAAYFSVAAGGLADVLHYVGESYVQVDRLIGASGGACSLFLILANDKSDGSASTAGLCPGADELLRSYLEYAESEGTGSWQRCWNAGRQMFSGVSNFWERKYLELLQDERAWTAIQHRAFCAVAARPIRQHLFGSTESGETFQSRSDNYIMHSFAKQEEAVQSFVATGEATFKGFVSGIPITSDEAIWEYIPNEDDVAQSPRIQSRSHVRLPSSFCDGGHPVAFDLFTCPENAAERHRNALLYYSTWFDNASDAALCTPESIEKLYKGGVDRTIDCLLNPSLMDKMIIIPSDANLQQQLEKIGRPADLSGGAQCGAKFASNEALKSVSYPIQALAKSSKTLPAMLGCLWSGKHITSLQWIAAFGITSGTAGFSMGGKKGTDIEAKLLGVLLLVVSLVCDGTVSAAQQGMRNQTERLSPYEQMFLTNLGAGTILVGVAALTGQLQAGGLFLMENTTILDEIAIFALCSAFGQVFIFLTISWFGPDTNAKITTVRKMATVLISIVWFGHSIDMIQWLMVGLVFASVFAEISEKLFRTKKPEKKEA